MPTTMSWGVKGLLDQVSQFHCWSGRSCAARIVGGQGRGQRLVRLGQGAVPIPVRHADSKGCPGPILST